MKKSLKTVLTATIISGLLVGSSVYLRLDHVIETHLEDNKITNTKESHEFLMKNLDRMTQVTAGMSEQDFQHGSVASGSAVKIGDGVYATAAHVVLGGDLVGNTPMPLIKITDPNTQHPKTIVDVQAFPELDLAIIRTDNAAMIDKNKFLTEKTTENTSLIGKKVFLLGFSQGNSITSKEGVVTIDNGNMITIKDAHVMPGDSGGAVFDKETGQLVGIITLKFDPPIRFRLINKLSASGTNTEEDILMNERQLMRKTMRDSIEVSKAVSTHQILQIEPTNKKNVNDLIKKVLMGGM